MIVGGGSNFVLLKTVLLCSGLATKSRPSQTFFPCPLPHGRSTANEPLHMEAPPSPLCGLLKACKPLPSESTAVGQHAERYVCATSSQT